MFPVFCLLLRVPLSVRALLSGSASEKNGKKNNYLANMEWFFFFEYSNDVFEITPFAADILARAHNYDFFISYSIQLKYAN